jgi:hypothetical protein
VSAGGVSEVAEVEAADRVSEVAEGVSEAAEGEAAEDEAAEAVTA